MIWQDISIPMKDPDASMEESYHIRNNSVNPEHDCVQDILDAKCKPADLQKYVNTYTHLTLSEQNGLYMLLKEYEELFGSTLSHWTRKPHHIELKPSVKPYYGWYYPVLKVYEHIAKLEIK